MRVERFFHIRDAFGDSKGGATVRVVGDTERVGQVDVQYVECSRKDNYNKAQGRSLSVKAPLKVVALRQLPDELKSIAIRARRHGRIGLVKTHYDYAVKYFLPKD